MPGTVTDEELDALVQRVTEAAQALIAGDIRDPQLGKLMLYQLSYAREASSVAMSEGTDPSSRARNGPVRRVRPGFTCRALLGVRGLA